MADCVVLLDRPVTARMLNRRLRVAKYRGSSNGTNEYPFLIEAGGISILPVASMGLNYKADATRISTGIPRLDAMTGGRAGRRAGYRTGR